jgi:hypothetical protein
MKTASKFFFTLVFFLSLSGVTHADTLAFDLPSVFKGAKDAVAGVLEKKEEVVSKEESTTTKEVVEELNNCEKYDKTFLNIFTLDLASEDAKQRIEKLEDTLEDESFLRDNIFGSVKSLFGLQKKDKVIFREMKKELSDAKEYYKNIDTFVSEAGDFLDKNSCEPATEVEKTLNTLDKNYIESEDKVLDEATYRKQFAASLKEKMVVLQKEVKNAKK